VCALWEHNNKFKKTNITKISIPDKVPGYDITTLLCSMENNNKYFIMPEVILRRD
jgi:hypothetical protein